MSTSEQLQAKFAEIEDILADAIENGEMQRGTFGSTIGTLFINNEGLLTYRIERASVLRALAEARRAELDRTIAYHRDQLERCHEAMDELNKLLM